MKPCTHCGGENRDEARFCGHCGQAFWIDTPGGTEPVGSSVRQVPNPRTATLLSCLWPGLGQIYNGQILKGAAFIVVHIFLMIGWCSRFTYVRAIVTLEALTGKNTPLSSEPPAIQQLFYSFLLFLGSATALWIYGMIDAKREAERRAGSNVSLKKIAALGALKGRVKSATAREWVIVMWAVVLIHKLSGESGRPTTTDWIFFIGVPVCLIGEWLTRVLTKKGDWPMLQQQEPKAARSAAITLATPIAAHRQLEQIGIPYTQDQFFQEAESGNTKAVELFLAAGMDPNTKGFMDTTALEEAVSEGHTDTVQVLLARGANPNQETPLGMTLLMLAANKGYTNIVRALLDKGAYVNAKGAMGLTALKLATQGGHADTVQLLKQAGARE